MNSKNRAFMKILSFLWLGPLLLAAPGVHAELADRTKPMNIEADAMSYDDVNKITTATGRVVATKGTIILRAGKVEVRQDALGNQATVATADAGKQAFLRQKREGLNEFIEGEANRIERDDKTQVSRLIGAARMRRLAGDKLVDEVVGDTIIYNDITEVYNVAGGGSTSLQSTQGAVPAGRVRAMLMPADLAGKGPARPAAPAAARSAATLKPSPAIGAGQ